MKIRSYNTQNKQIEAKIENVENKQEKLEHQKVLREEKRLLESTLESYEKTPEFKVRWNRIEEIKKELGE